MALRSLSATQRFVYYSPQGYWNGITAIKKLADAAKVPEETAKQWLIKRALWQIYFPAPRYVPRPKFDVSSPNEVHQADANFQIRADRCRCRQQLQEAEPLTSEDSAELAKAFQSVYKCSPSV